MQGKLPLAMLFALLANSAFAAGPQPVVAFTFTCNGNPSQRTGACPDGNQPNSLIQGSDGNFYGTTEFSASGEPSSRVRGTVFSVTPAGKFTLMHSFVAGANGSFPNGANPTSLTEGPDGQIYGLAVGGNGILFRIGKTGSGFKVIHRFCSAPQCSDGLGSAGALVVGQDGNIYGATSQGGTGCSGVGCGTIFRVTPSSGVYQVVSTFASVAAGFPGGLTPASDGSLYGMTIQGLYLFRFTPATSALELTKLPFPFPSGCGTGCIAEPFLAIGANGNLYGLYTLYIGGGLGLFEIQLDGSNLQLFPQYNTTRSGGRGLELLLASDGNFWIPESVGSNGNGDLIAISPSDGKALQNFAPFSTSAPVGALPSWLIQAKDGTLWGTVSEFGVVSKGHFGGGTVYSLNAGLPPQ